MKYTVRMLLITWLVLAWVYPVFAASPYSNNANLAVQWLSSHQNIDGSWGDGDTKYPSTSEAVLALQAMNQRNSAYYWGISWLENHSPANSDFMTRRILALAPHGDNVSAEMTSLQTAQAGDNGWGLTSAYQGSPLDSALALLAYSQQNIATNVPVALAYLKSAQLTTANDMGWSVAQETVSDPATTALVVLALVANRTSDSTLNTNIANGVTALSAKVDASSPAYLQALAALAYLKAGYMVQGTELLNSLATAQSQSADGSLGQDAYATAITARAMAVAMGTDVSNLSATVSIPDPNLRAAINSALGRNSMDALTKGDLANLTTLNAQNRGITNLTGLEWAVNLTSLDLRGNNISSFAPLSGLTNLSQIQTDSTLTVSKTGTGAGTITSSPAGISCGAMCTGTFDANTQVTLIATPSPGKIFTGWSGACSGRGSCTVTLSSPQSVSANFVPDITPILMLLLSDDDPLDSIVTMPDAGLRAAVNASLGRSAATPIRKRDMLNLTTLIVSGMGITDLTGLELAVNLSSVDLRNNLITSTTPLAGLTLLSPASINLDGNPALPLLTITKTGNGTGTITSSTAEIVCGDTCTRTYITGTTVTLVPSVAAGSRFTGWSGCDSVAGNACTVTMTSGRNVAAAFKRLDMIPIIDFLLND